ncbi:hypothetical protein GF337_16365 [candidate division KSB1 bacterium]|nr:hypothetical protein [candidate division KSB1 bacterium]
MSFTGSEDHSISLSEASKLTKNYRDHAEANAKKGGFFGKATLSRILDQDGCVGIRFYYGAESDGTPVMVLIGVDSEENDMTDGEVAERSLPCPPYCGNESDLNS